MVTLALILFKHPTAPPPIFPPALFVLLSVRGFHNNQEKPP